MSDSSDDTPVAIGVLSTAHVHAEEYVDILTEADDVDLIGVADDEDRGRTFAEEHDTNHLELDALLSAADGVIVCSENATHERWVRAAADANVDILCEKPLATTLEEARSIVSSCTERDASLGIAMPLRHSVPARRAGDLLEAGVVGTIQAISGTNRGQMPGGWFTDPEAGGGGAVMDHTVHVVDLVHWLTGERVREVYAETGTRFHDLPVEDVNVLSMVLSDGTQFSLDGSWSKPSEWHFWGDLTLELIGTNGAVSVDCFDETFAETSSDPDPGSQSEFWGTDPNELMLRRFVERIRRDLPPETSPEEGVAAVAVVEAAYESAERTEPVTVEYR